MKPALKKLFSQPINRLLLLSFMLVALIPVSLLGLKIYNTAWENAWREIYEKHRLLAMNLAAPIRIFIEDRRRLMGMLSISVSEGISLGENHEELYSRLFRARHYFTDFAALSLVGLGGQTNCLLIMDDSLKNISSKYQNAYQQNATFKNTIDNHEWSISGIERSNVTGKPIIFMSYPVIVNGEIRSILIGELNIDTIEALRKRIHFGVKGHSAIVDNHGRALAHPNPAWMKEMKDLSHLDIVQKMLAGENGVTQFYSPFIKQDMVAGYTGIPGLGWGIMVPQPKSEVDEQVRKLLYAHLTWAMLGLLLAILLAVILARWITRPMNKLAESARYLLANELQGQLPEVDEHTPKELTELNNALINLVSALQKSRLETGELNESLQDRVEDATSQLRKVNTKLQEHARTADNASLAKSQFLANMSHELRTPLNAIIGYAELLIEDGGRLEPDNVRNDLTRIVISAQHLLKLINDILDISKIEAGKMALDPVRVDIKDLLTEVEFTIKPLAIKRGNHFTVKSAENVDFLYTDRLKLQQILLNILSNANKFTENGSVDLKVSRIGNEQGEWMEFTVIDTGIGIPEKKVSTIFESFNQVDSDTTRQFGGTGLGLTISRHFVTMMGGDITVESKRGVGSTFTICLPARTAESQDILAASLLQ